VSTSLDPFTAAALSVGERGGVEAKEERPQLFFGKSLLQLLSGTGWGKEVRGSK
jgi:hypothetical protein